MEFETSNRGHSSKRRPHAAGNVVCLEILRASTRLADPKAVEYRVLPSTGLPTVRFVQAG